MNGMLVGGRERTYHENGEGRRRMSNPNPRCVNEGEAWWWLETHR